MKSFLSFVAIGFAFAATTISAKAQCVASSPFGPYIVDCPPPMLRSPMPIEQPKQRREKAHHPAPVHHQAPVHHVTKRPKPQQHDEEKEPSAKGAPAPALPR